jgi:Holliday junction DNA helicase RuvA
MESADIMYAYIKGILIQKKEEYIVLEAAGIGYKIYCHPPLQDRFGKTGDSVCVYTYLYVREDTFALYGFPSQEEHDMFVMLLQVTGIGPKVALALVAQIMPSQFALAVITGDVKRLTQVKGVGKKGAERLILELKDKLKGFAFEGPDGTYTMDDAGVSLDSDSLIMQEAMNALVVLGYSGIEARKAVTAVYKEEIAVEELIRLSLRALV